jgi:hypothetical protein
MTDGGRPAGGTLQGPERFARYTVGLIKPFAGLESANPARQSDRLGVQEEA